LTKLLAKTKSGYVKQSRNVTIKQTEGNIAIVLHNARLNLINRHFWITPSDWSITFSQLRITDTLIPYIPSRARDNTYFFTVVRGFPRTYRRHDLRTFDRAATIDESTVLSAWCPVVHETFVSLHFSDGSLVELQSRVKNHRCYFHRTRIDRRWSIRALFCSLVFFNYVYGRQETGFGQNEWLAPIASTVHSRVISSVLGRKSLIHYFL